jgi:hypothetical protein
MEYGNQIMPSSRTRVVLLVAMLVAAGCGYVRSGTWDDVPENWGRAFESTKPDAVVVVHSRYWRAPHFTYEAGYMFETQPNAALREQLFGKNRLRRLSDAEVAIAERSCFSECPPWFAPKPLDQYEIWAYTDHPESDFRLLIDKTTGHLFMADYQI